MLARLPSGVVPSSSIENENEDMGMEAPDVDAGKKRRKARHRKKKQEQKAAEAAAVRVPADANATAKTMESSSLSHQTPAHTPASAETLGEGPSTESLEALGDDRFDETLLAIVGILDVVKYEDNVAGWIHAGGLWGPDGSSLPSELNNLAKPSSSTEVNEGGLQHSPGKRELSANAEESTPKRLRPSPPSAPTSPQERLADLQEESVAPSGEGRSSVPPGNDGTSPQGPVFWFHRSETVRYWAVRGRAACEKLGVEVTHGIER